jgi:hypothetical protein
MKISLVAFFMLWADRMRWEVPDVHIRACHWLEHRGDLAVLRCFRGFGKSTLLAVYNAWRYYQDPTYRILHQSEADPTAYKTSRDTQNVLRNHPLTEGLLPPGQGTVEQWWVDGSSDARNASMYARGILSNVTSARADECQNDDVEVPRNIQTPEAREKLEYRLSEQTFILVPGGRQLFIGTPHTHDSLYDKMEALGSDCLTIPLFRDEYPIDDAKHTAYDLPFAPEYVFFGVGKNSRLMVEGVDYQVKGKRLIFASAPGGLVDCYAGCAWPERFDRADLEKRRRKTKTKNYWDSQYQLHSKPVHELRLDPAKIRAYALQPRLETANRQVRMMLGHVQIVSGRAYWDPSLGKVGGDASAFSVVYDDSLGNYYWHACEALTGEFAEFSDTRNTVITAGQVLQACDIIARCNILHVYVETNGAGSFTGKLLQRALKQRNLACGVTEVQTKANKNDRILGALEPPLKSGTLWAHVDVLDGPLWDQMKDWNPAVRQQPDDFLDSGAGAIEQAPVRINKTVEKPTPTLADDWRGTAGVHEVTLEV